MTSKRIYYSLGITKNGNHTMNTTNDRLIRDALLEHLYKIYPIGGKARIIEELGVMHGASRVDLAVVNGVLHGFEIKSDMDTLYRLSTQIRDYNAVFNKMTIVVGTKHLEDVINVVPEWWGVLLARQNTEGHVSLYQIREGLVNNDQNNEAIARLLWKDEAIEVLRELKAERGVVSQPRSVVYERLAKTLDAVTLQKYVRDILSSRKDWRVDQA